MDFISFEFAGFAILLICIYHITGSGYRHLVLLAASYIFYGIYDVGYLALLIGITFLSFTSGILVSARRSVAFPVMAGFSCLLVMLLVWFKYGGILVDQLNDTRFTDSFFLDTVVPVGFSFYALQALGYTLDVYKGKQEPETDYLSFSVFLGFFPQLLSGPIERHTNLAPQLKTLKDISYDNLVAGCYLIILGIMKKLVVANNLLLYRQYFLSNIPSAGQIDTAVYAVATLFWVFFDFSAYTDIARGLARIFGVSLTENFTLPLAAKSMTAFWSNWHISLTRWLRDYLYFPLVKLGKSISWSIVCTLLIFLVMGLWHAWSYIFFFAFSGMVVALELVLKKFARKGNRIAVLGDKLLANNFTVLVILCASSIFYGIPSFDISFEIVNAFLEGGLSRGFRLGIYKYLGIGMLAGIMLEWVTRQSAGNDDTVRLIMGNITLRWLYPVLAFYAIAFLSGNVAADFFYYGF